MSWKSIVTAGLLCVLVTPAAFAVATLQAVKGGTHATGFLNAAGNWVWLVRITPTGGSSVGTEIGFRETTSSELVGATNANSLVWDKNNFGQEIFGWEDLPPAPEFGEGIEVNLPTDEVFTALGSAIIPGATAQDYVLIETQGPSTNGRLSTTLQWLGIYTGQDTGGVNGQIAETIANVKTFSDVAGSATFTAKAGDANLDNSVDAADFTTWLSNIGVAPGAATWYAADFNDDNSVDATDFTTWLGNIGSGAGGIASGAAVPEPGSLALIGLGSLLVGGLRLRKR